MKSFLKWAGGKEAELPIIIENLPYIGGRYVEPFIGGGAVFFALDYISYINDKSTDLINLYECIRDFDEDFFENIETFNSEFFSLNLMDTSELLDVYIGKENPKTFIEKNKDYLPSSPLFLFEISKSFMSKIRRSTKLEERKEIPNEDRIKNMQSALKSAYYMYIRYIYNSRKNTKGLQSALYFS